MLTIKPRPGRAAAVAIGLLAAFAAPLVASAQPAASTRPGLPNAFVKPYKLDQAVAARARGNPLQRSTVLVRLAAGADLPAPFRQYARGGRLNLVNGVVLEGVPNGLLGQLAASAAVASVHDDRPVLLHNYRTAVTVGARAVQQTLGLTGLGVGVAIIDSGVATYHDDLTPRTGSTLYPYGNQRVARFVDFVGGRSLPYDDHGHGTHVAGIIAGNGYDSNGEKAGIAPDASLVVLKVLDAQGRGTIAGVIAALDWVSRNARTYNIRVVNLSVGAAVRESYWTDPLTLAVKALTDQGIVVVAAAGNLGKNASGRPQYGGITAPGNAPWTLTVGASSTQGTTARSDDVVADYSSRGPTYIDWAAKPDLVAPGSGTISLAAPGSTLYTDKAPYLVAGSVATGSLPYLTLTGTSMAAPVVAGTVALMLQANPSLTPNLVKAILQYTAQVYPGYDPLTEGAGFLNTLGAVELAKFYAGARPGRRLPLDPTWSRQVLWGSHRITGGVMVPGASAWRTDVVWGSAKTPTGANVVWGVRLRAHPQPQPFNAAGPLRAALTRDNIVWGTFDNDNIVWGTLGRENIVWGTWDADNIVWGTWNLDSIVWGTWDLDNIVWGTFDNDNIVWGTWDADNIVWGTLDADNIVWGTLDSENIVWGTDCGGADCDHVIWGAVDQDNIVWGTAQPGDAIVWGTWDADNIVWGTWDLDNIVWGTSAGDVMWSGAEAGR